MALKLKGVFSRKSKDKKGKDETSEDVNDNGGGMEATSQPNSEELSPEDQTYDDEVVALQDSTHGDAKSYCSNSDAKSIGTDHTAGTQRTAARRAKSRRQLREESKRALNAELMTSSRHSRRSLRSLECGNDDDDDDDDGFLGGDLGAVISIPGSPHATASSTNNVEIEKPRQRSNSRGRRSRDQPLSLRDSEHGQERRDRSLAREERCKSNDEAARRRKERSKSKDPTARADDGTRGGHVLNQLEDTDSTSRKADSPSSNEIGAPDCDDKAKGVLDQLQSATASQGKSNPEDPEVIERVPLNDSKAKDDILSEVERTKSELEFMTRRGRRGKSKDRLGLSSSSHQPRSRSIDKRPTRSKSKGSSRDPSGSSSRSSSRGRSSGDRKPRSRSSDRRKKRLESGSNNKAVKQESMRLLFGATSKAEEETVVAGNTEDQQKPAEKVTSAIAEGLSAIDVKESADTSKDAFVEATRAINEKHVDHPMKESKEQRRARRSKDHSQRRSTSRDRRPPPRSSKNLLDLQGEGGAICIDSIPRDSKSGRTAACDKSIPRNSSRSSRDKENNGRSSARSLRLSDHGSQHCERPRSSSSRKDNEANANSRDKAEQSREETAPVTEKQFQTVAVVFHDKEEETADSKTEQVKLEMNPLVALLRHAGTSEAGVEVKKEVARVPSTPNLTKQDSFEDTEDSHTELTAAMTPETAPCRDPIDGGTAYESKEPNLDNREASPQIVVKAEKPEGDNGVTVELLEKERRRAERRARRENKKKESSKTLASHDGDSNMTALLGHIGSTKEDFEPKQDSSAAIALFDSRPQSSVEFFQSLISPCTNAAAGSPSRSDRRYPETRDVSRSKSDIVKDVAVVSGRQTKRRSLPKKTTSLRDVLSASEHVKSRRRTAGDESSLPPPSLAGDTYLKSKKKNNKNGQGEAIKEEEDQQEKLEPAGSSSTSTTKTIELRANFAGGSKDIFALMESEQQTTGGDPKESNCRSRKVRRSKEKSKVDDADADESLAPPSLAGNTVHRATEEGGATNKLHALSEEEEDRSTDTPLQTPLQILPKKTKSFVHLALEDDDDDSFVDELTSKPKADELGEDDKKKKRSSMMKQMKKASVSTSKVVGKKSKGVMKKATSARNVFGQVATKAFTWGKEDGEGLLKSSD